MGARRPIWLKVPRRRYAAIAIALAGLVVVCAIFEPSSLNATSRGAVLPLASFLAIVAMGQALVIRTGGIDLSVPAVMGAVAMILRLEGNSGGASTGQLWRAIVIALACATLIGFVNGVLVAILRLNALIVTLSTGGIVAGYSAWYQFDHEVRTNVPPELARFGAERWVGQNPSVFIAAALVAVAAFVFSASTFGRRFTAAGTNNRAAELAGIRVARYTIAGYAVAGLFYGTAAILLSGFLGSPTLDVGRSFLLTPIVAVVLAGVSLAGGSGSMIAIALAALFLRQLDQFLATLGAPTSASRVVEGVFIVVGMLVASADRDVPAVQFVRRRMTVLRRPTPPRVAGAA